MTGHNFRKLDVFPAFHKVDGKKILIVGSGEAAAAKVRLLGQSSARIVVITGNPELALQEAIRLVGASHIQRDFVSSDVDSAVLVFAASEIEAIDAFVVTSARAQNVPVNAVDQPSLCDFYTPALVNRAPFAIAITSSGAAPVLARQLRARIEALLSPRFGDIAKFSQELRKSVVSTLGSSILRRRFWSKFFSSHIPVLIEQGHRGSANRETAKLLASDLDDKGFVWLVGAGPGAEDLLTLRAQRILQDADVIIYDALVPEGIVSMGRRDAERLYVGKRAGKHSIAQGAINKLIVREAQKGRKVVRLKSGDPLVFGRAGEEFKALRAANVDFEVVPGITAAMAAAASARIPLTLRGTASTLIMATGQDMTGETLPGWVEQVANGASVAIYMGKTVAGCVADRLMSAGVHPATPVAIIENASRPDELQISCILSELHQLENHDDLCGPVVILVGEAIAQGRIGVPLSILEQIKVA